MVHVGGIISDNEILIVCRRENFMEYDMSEGLDVRQLCYVILYYFTADVVHESLLDPEFESTNLCEHFNVFCYQTTLDPKSMAASTFDQFRRFSTDACKFLTDQNMIFTIA